MTRIRDVIIAALSIAVVSIPAGGKRLLAQDQQGDPEPVLEKGEESTQLETDADLENNSSDKRIALLTFADPEPGGGVPQAPSAPPPEFAPPHDSFPGFFDSHFSGSAWKDYVWDDYLTQPAVLLPLGLAVAAAGVSHWDRPLERHIHGVLGDRASIGNIGLYTLVGGAVLNGVLLPGEGRNGWDNFFTEGEAFAVTGLTVFALKMGVQRHRPEVGRFSFPSGHASHAFAGATLIEGNSGHIMGLPAYALASLTAFSRVEAGRHYPSDVLAGAAIGTLSAGIIDALHWGRGPGEGGIARRPVDCSVSVEGRRAFELEITLRF